MASVTVIVPAFNAAKTLDATLESVVKQTFADWELIVFDDASTDDTAALAKARCDADRRLRLVTGSAGGAGAARNQAARHANAPWLLFLDADDLIREDHLELTLAAAARSPAPDLVYAAGARLSADGRMGAPEIPPKSEHFSYLGRHNIFYTHACLIRRAVFDQFGGFDTTLATCEDWDLWQRLARAGAVMAGVDECLAYYRMRPSSLSHDASRVFADAREVILRAHGADPRVSNPLPTYAQGLDASGIANGLIGIAVWCAALLIGSGRSAVPFLESAELPPANDVNIDGPVSMMQGGVPSGASLLKEDWPALWHRFNDGICEAFAILERRYALEGFASRCLSELLRRLGESSRNANGRGQRCLSSPAPAASNGPAAEEFVHNLRTANVASVMVMAAHPDDEVIGAGGHLAFWPRLSVVHVTNGAPADEEYARRVGHFDPQSYAAARRREAETALSLIGVAADRLIALRFDDQQASFKLAEIARAIVDLFGEHRPEIVVTHAYEGGHPDHDATCFAVHCACRIVNRAGRAAPKIVEMSSYFGRDGIRVTSSFLGPRPPSVAITLDKALRDLKRSMLSCHTSQSDLINLFPIGVESFRCAPAYDFRTAPHAGELFYEYHDLGMNGARWRELANDALTALGLSG